MPVPQALGYRCSVQKLDSASPQATLLVGMDPGQIITSFLVLALSTGAVVNLSLGASGDPIPAQVGLSIATDACNPMSQGIFATWAAQAGQSITILALFGGGAVALQGA
jgi:hypothetical protein